MVGKNILMVLFALTLICVSSFASVESISFTTNPSAPNSFGWFNTNVSVNLSTSDSSEIRYCREGVTINTTESCIKLNPLWRYTTCVILVKCPTDTNFIWNKDNNIVKYIPKLAEDYAIFYSDVIFSTDANQYIKYFNVPSGLDVNQIDLSISAQKKYVPVDRATPAPQMFLQSNSARGLINSGFTFTSTTGLILLKLSLNGTGVDSPSGIDYCKVNFEYASNPTDGWSEKRALADLTYVAYRYTSAGEKTISVMCKDKADNNNSWFSTPIFKIIIVAPNYPTGAIMIQANPNPINLNTDYNLVYSAPDANKLTKVTFDINGPNYSFSVEAIKESDGNFVATVNPVAERFAGIIHVTAKVIDTFGYTENFSNDFNTFDDVVPLIGSVQEYVIAEATDTTGAIVDYSANIPTSTDFVDGELIPVCLPANNTLFVIDANTLVTCTATDLSGNFSSNQFYVSVVDTTAPVIDAVEDIIAEATDLNGATVTITPPNYTDVVDGTHPADCNASTGSFPLGITAISCAKTDAHNNVATQVTFTVTVEDTTAPIIDSVENIIAEATDSNGATVTITPPLARDAYDGNIFSDCNVSNGIFLLGTTSITCTKTDASGNIATPVNFSVTVRDTTNPVMISLTATITNRNVFLNYLATDINSTGVKGYFVSRDGVTWA